jgi:hypothetical protein
MYYGERQRLRQMQKLLERFAYISILTDSLIAASTYLVMQSYAYSSSLLMMTDYLDLLEVIIAAGIIVTILALRYYKSTLTKLHLYFARRMYRGDLRLLGVETI